MGGPGCGKPIEPSSILFFNISIEDMYVQAGCVDPSVGPHLCPDISVFYNHQTKQVNQQEYMCWSYQC